MHVFQPLPIEETELNPFKTFGKDWAALTAMAEGKVNAMTISWGALGELWGKHVVTVYVRESRYTKTLMDKSEVFSLTFFEEHYRSTLKYLGAASGHNEEKIKSAKLNINIEQEVPFIDQGQFIILCKKICGIPLDPAYLPEEVRSQYYPDGDPHTMYIGEILGMSAR